MDKQLVSRYGWIIIVTLVMSVMLAFATPFGQYVGKAVLNTANGIIGVSDEALSDENVSKMENMWSDKIDNIQNENDKRNLMHNHTIPKGGVYYVGVNTTETLSTEGYTQKLTEGNKFPEPSSGDVYIYGDYFYKYNYRKAITHDDSSAWVSHENMGWGVAVIDNTKTTYGDPLYSIANKNIIALSATYAFCTSLTDVPIIPDMVVNISSAFANCESLVVAPVIPETVVDMHSVFYNCSNLKTYKGSKDEDGNFFNYKIPNTARNMESAFKGCVFLTTSPVLPNSITQLSGTFKDCISLTTAPTIPDNVTHMNSSFENCTSLKTAPKIPDGVRHMWATFKGCTSLEKAPEIPQSVITINEVFSNCTSLTGQVVINCLYIDEYLQAFYNCGQSSDYDDFIIIKGSISESMKRTLCLTGYKKGCNFGYVMDNGKTTYISY